MSARRACVGEDGRGSSSSRNREPREGEGVVLRVRTAVFLGRCVVYPLLCLCSALYLRRVAPNWRENNSLRWRQPLVENMLI